VQRFMLQEFQLAAEISVFLTISTVIYNFLAWTMKVSSCQVLNGKFSKLEVQAKSNHAVKAVLFRLICSPRRSNFTEDDQLLLTMLVRPHVSTLNDKRATETVNRAKEKVWKEICAEYNLRRPLNYWEPSELCSLFGRMKVKSKHDATSYQRKRSLTGGGPKPQSPAGPSKEMMSLVPQVCIYKSYEVLWKVNSNRRLNWSGSPVILV
jgi:hypothetical protein